jgi:hypothetical protein
MSAVFNSVYSLKSREEYATSNINLKLENIFYNENTNIALLSDFSKSYKIIK